MCHSAQGLCENAVNFTYVHGTYKQPLLPYSGGFKGSCLRHREVENSRPVLAHTILSKSPRIFFGVITVS